MYPQQPPQLRWVATPPPGAPGAAQPARRPGRYTGPPAYAAPPRWGFPALTWRWPTSVPSTQRTMPPAVDRLRYLSGNAMGVLWLLAGLALLSGAAEIWRYALLLASREGALDGDVVSTSDVLLVIASVLAMIVAAGAAALIVWWLCVARLAVAEVSGRAPARSTRQTLLCLLVPGLNLVLAGPVLAELEHDVLQRPPADRPKPTRLVLAWWAAWVVSGLVFTVSLIWRWRDGVQAQADGVLLSAVNDLLVVALAVLTALFVRRVTQLVAPARPAQLRKLRVLKVEGAPEPPLRAVRPAGAVR